MQKQRRDFLKITAAGAAGLALTRRANRAFAAWPGTGTMAVNSAIDNMRVVACQDSQMMKSLAESKLGTTYQNEQTLVDSCQVQANMDAMAMQLAQVATADAAWKAIFRTSKTWAATKVAIKVNGIAPQNMASVAVLEKFSNIFTGFGVLPTNIFIYDGSSLGAAGIPTLASYFSTTDTTKIPGVVGNNSILGGTINATIPGGGSAACTADIANGTIDILVNVANNKGHNQSWTGNVTLSMKNHFGTFPPTHNLDSLFNFNKSDAILGGTFVRQQLCFIDSLLANSKINTGNPDTQPNYLIMGVFGPAVDYLTCKKVREPSVAAGGMGCTNLIDATIDQYITTFGYATTDPVWVVVPAATGANCTGGGTGGTGGGAGGASGGGGGSSGSGGAGSGGTSASGGAQSGGSSGSGGAGNGGTSGSGGVASGGASGSGGVASGGTSGSGGAAGGGASGSGGVASGGNSGSGGAAGGGSSGSGGARSGGSNGSGGVASGGSNGPGGAASGGIGASGGAASGGIGASGGAASGGAPGSSGGASGAGGSGGAATSVASGGSATSGGTSAGAGTGGSGGNTPANANSGSGCAVAGVDRRATRWGAMLAFGAVLAEKLRRLVSDSDRSS